MTQLTMDMIMKEATKVLKGMEANLNNTLDTQNMIIREFTNIPDIKSISNDKEKDQRDDFICGQI